MARRRENLLPGRTASSTRGTRVFRRAVWVGAVVLAAIAGDRCPSFAATGESPRKPLNQAAWRKAPFALSPEESLAMIKIPAGFRVEVMAAEPLIADPVAFDWDERGRLWVVEMADYPVGMDNEGKPGGRIRRVEDADGDGRYDRSTVFADGLPFPNGILTWRDGVIVTAAPEILFLRDIDGDGTMDERIVLISGLQEGNPQLRANGLRWGLDNWVHVASGGHRGNYGTETTLTSNLTGKTISTGGRDFRFRPDTGDVEPQSGPTQFGRNRDDYGRWFGTQNANPLWHYVLPDQYLRRNPYFGAEQTLVQLVTPPSAPVYPASVGEKRYRHVELAGHFTSACGGMIYRGGGLFSEGEIHAFACEPFSNLVQHYRLQDAGVTFSAKRVPGLDGVDFFASADPWCRPVMVRDGPDGALWIADMYRAMIEHPQFLPPEGKQEMLPRYRAADDRGRIYRVSREGSAPYRFARLDTLSDLELVAALKSPQGWYRDKAHQSLLWRNRAEALAPLLQLAEDSSDPLARVHALCVLDGLGKLPADSVARALRDPNPGVRENALRLAESRWTPEVLTTAVGLAADADAKVRLQLALSLGESTDARAGTALARILERDAGDSMVVGAVLSSALPHLSALVAVIPNLEPARRSILTDLLVPIALKTNDRAALANLIGSQFMPAAGNYTSGQLAPMVRLLGMFAKHNSSPEELRRLHPDDALGRLLNNLNGIFAFAWQISTDPGVSLSERMTAAALLVRDESRKAKALQLLAGWLQARHPAEVQIAAIRALGETGESAVPMILAKAWVNLDSVSRPVALATWMGREPWTYDLVERLDREEISLSAIDPTQRARLRQHESTRVRKLAVKLFAGAASSTRSKVIADYRDALRLPGELLRGRNVYLRACAACHRHGTDGRDVGPDLISVAAHSREKLLSSILDPSVDIQPGYNAYVCTLETGEQIYGFLLTETAQSVTFKQLDGTQRTVLRNQITSLQSQNVSLMPEGLEAAVPLQDMADLLAFLRGETR